MKLEKGDEFGLTSVQSKFGRVETGTNCTWPGVGRTSRLLRSKLWQNIACACDVDGERDACGILLS